MMFTSTWSTGSGGQCLVNGPQRTKLALARWVCLATLVACLVVSPHAAGTYPLMLTLDANATAGAAAVSSTVTIRIDRLMEENRRTRVTDALSYGGYPNFLTALRSIPAVGAIGLQKRSVDIRYAREQQEGTGRRVVLIADHPLFFLSADPGKARAGYELTVVELRFDDRGGVTGTMAGAARVKPSADGPVLDDYAEAPVRLTMHQARP
jgi:hypothetical protein